MEAQSIRTLTMFSPLLHFHINLRLVRVVVGVCVCMLCVVVYRSVTCGGTALPGPLHYCTGGPIDDSNPEQGRIELATLGMLSLHAGHGVVLLLEVFHVLGELPVDVFGQHSHIGEE